MSELQDLVRDAMNLLGGGKLPGHQERVDSFLRRAFTALDRDEIHMDFISRSEDVWKPAVVMKITPDLLIFLSVDGKDLLAKPSYTFPYMPVNLRIEQRDGSKVEPGGHPLYEGDFSTAMKAMQFVKLWLEG